MSGALNHDLVILGGGPAGASAACRLARQGRTTLLLERHTQPQHRICGEFLSVEAQADLAELGIDPLALGGSPIHRVTLVRGSWMAQAPLPFTGVGLTRRVLDEALLSRAAASGATIRRGSVAREVEAQGKNLLVHLRGEEALASRTVFLATGKHDLRHPRRPTPSAKASLIGFKTYFALAPGQRAEIKGAVEVILFEGGYAGLQTVEGGMVNLCLLVQQALFERVGRSWSALLDHLCGADRHLRQRLDGSTPLLERPLSISGTPYGFIHRDTGTEPDGLFRLGDQTAVIPSFSGDGISIALHTGRLAAEAYLERGNDARRYQRSVRRDLRGQVGLASALYGLSRARLGQVGLVQACQKYPGLLRRLAAWTRVPPRAWERAPGAAAWSSG